MTKLSALAIIVLIILGSSCKKDNPLPGVDTMRYLLRHCAQLPRTQLHFAQNDVITRPSQGEALVKTMTDAGNAANISLFIYKDRDHSTIANNNTDMQQRIEDFFKSM